ncbi:PD-(D/E)XK motif protein [Streptomyces cinereoruber]|uniref:PD-(D/E)XK motif protein n=1 Tax=Streptomyces cinereoruber TaxID=67260 RepID=UPI003640476A
MTVTEDDWYELEQPHDTPGRSSRRLHPGAPVDVFLAVSHPRRERMLVMRADARSAAPVVRAAGRLPRTAGIEMNLNAASRLQYELQLVLTSSDLSEVFNPLVTDVAETVTGTSEATTALTAALDRFARWQDLLRTVGQDGLGAEARRGLYGELLVLEQILEQVPEAAAVEAWTGPTGSNQDFQLADLAIEVKSSAAKQPRSVRISSERQLDGNGIPHLLLCLVALDERRGGSGESLNRRVDSVRSKLSVRAPVAVFDQLLIRAGFLPGHRDLYNEPRYTTRELTYWHVRDGFPRLVESDLPDGVSDCTYHLTLSGLSDYQVDREEVDQLIGDNDGQRRS